MQIFDTSIVRVPQDNACIAGNREQWMCRSSRGLTTKIDANFETGELPIRLAPSTAKTHDKLNDDALAE